jgi:hypothetical protein
VKWVTPSNLNGSKRPSQGGAFAVLRLPGEQLEPEDEDQSRRDGPESEINELNPVVRAAQDQREADRK